MTQREILTDRQRLLEQLQMRGFTSHAAETKAAMFSRCTAWLAAQPGGPTPWEAHFVPGRIEVLGKHTDYAGGSTLGTAVERGFCLVAAARADATVEITDVVRGESIHFALSPVLDPMAGVPIRRVEIPGGAHMDCRTSAVGGQWSTYPLTVARRLARNFAGMDRGVTMAFGSDLPPAAGMSSSSALMVSCFLALADANALWWQPDFAGEFQEAHQLAGYLGTIENGQSFGRLAGDSGVGTFGGSQDHTAMLCARPGWIVQFAYAPTRFERALPLPAGYTFAIATSGVAAEKTGEARDRFNRVSLLAAAVATVWRRYSGQSDLHIAGAVRSRAGVVAELRAALADAAYTGGLTPAGRQQFSSTELLTRLEHFLVENEEVIPAAGMALWRGDLDAFGRLVDQSQEAAERLLGNQIPETIHLAAAARRLGAVAASAFGAGFGGSVWALIEAPRAADFLAAWRADYLSRYPQNAAQAEFFATTAGPASFRV